MKFADLHNHSAPGVDDGCRSLEESLETLAQFREVGVGHVVCTPHLSLPQLKTPLALNDEVLVQALAIEELREAAREAGALPSVYSGQEIWARNAEEVRRVVRRNDVGLADTDYLLVEFGFRPGYQALETIEAVREAGRRIVVAHPERYPFEAGSDPVSEISRWVEAGAFLQVNLGSCFGAFRGWGGQSEWLSWALLERGLVHLVASDHHGHQRPQILHARFLEAMRERGAASQAEQLLGENPCRILKGESPLSVAPVARLEDEEAAA